MSNVAWEKGFFRDEHFFIDMSETVLPWFREQVIPGTTLSLDGTKLQYYFALNPNKGKSITFVHGFCEFYAKYQEMMYLFYQAGYSVFFLELRGHGTSQRFVDDPNLVHVDSFEEYVDDVFAFQNQIVHPNSRGDVHILFGHSMGGCVSALFLEKYPQFFDKAILASPMLELQGKAPNWKMDALAMMNSNSETLNKAPAQGAKEFTGIPDFEHSSALSEARYLYQFYQRIQNETYQTNGATNGWMRAAYPAMKEAIHQASHVQCPVLVLQAEHDHLVLPGGQYQFSEKAKKAILLTIPDTKHEIFNALDQARHTFFEVIFTFLETPISTEDHL